jgi:hypothetical protein
MASGILSHSGLSAEGSDEPEVFGVTAAADSMGLGFTRFIYPHLSLLILINFGSKGCFETGLSSYPILSSSVPLSCRIETMGKFGTQTDTGGIIIDRCPNESCGGLACRQRFGRTNNFFLKSWDSENPDLHRVLYQEFMALRKVVISLPETHHIVAGNPRSLLISAMDMPQ